jgi:SprT-like family protein
VLQLSLWAPEEGRPANAAGAALMPPLRPLAGRLQDLGLPPFAAITTHRNGTIVLSWVPGRVLRVHEGFAAAPDEVLRAIVRFVTPGTRRAARLEARGIFLNFPVDQHAPPTRPPGARRDRPRSGDVHLVGQLEGLRAELNQVHFEGRLPVIPIRLSGRMRSRLGDLRLERRTGQAVEITLSRRHIRRDGWAAVTDTLLHELVHQWQAETGRPVDHGAEFRRKAREVGIEPRAVLHERLGAPIAGRAAGR